MRRLPAAIAGLAAAAFFVAPVGHHSMSMFDNSKEVLIKGAVARLDWKNPHIDPIVETVGEDGKKQLIQGEGLAITQALVDGLQKDDSKPGMPVVMRANPNRLGPGKTVRVLDVTTQDGKIHPFDAIRTRTLTPAKSLAGNWAPSRQSMTAAWGDSEVADHAGGPRNPEASQGRRALLPRADAVPRDARRAAHHPHRP